MPRSLARRLFTALVLLLVLPCTVLPSDDVCGLVQVVSAVRTGGDAYRQDGPDESDEPDDTGLCYLPASCEARVRLVRADAVLVQAMSVWLPEATRTPALPSPRAGTSWPRPVIVRLRI